MMERLLAAQKKSLARSPEELPFLWRSGWCGSFSSGNSILRVEFNPGRITSTSATTDARTVSRQALFPLRENLPPAQKGILYRGEYLVPVQPLPDF